VSVSAIEEREVKERVAEILTRRPAAGLAVGVVRNGVLESFYGHGVADMASSAPVTEDTAVRIASITKTFTAVAVMQLWEQGLVDLDAPADGYLRAGCPSDATSASTSSNRSAWRARTRSASGCNPVWQGGMSSGAGVSRQSPIASMRSGALDPSIQLRGTWPASPRRWSEGAPTITGRCSNRRRSR
jgi:Beta-lactamase